jgi:hypothetical protein
MLQIAELKDYFEDYPDTTEYHARIDESSRSDGLALLLGNYQRLNKQQILSTIPSRSTVDRLVAKYFNTVGITTGVDMLYRTDASSALPWPNVFEGGKRLSSYEMTRC